MRQVARGRSGVVWLSVVATGSLLALAGCDGETEGNRENQGGSGQGASASSATAGNASGAPADQNGFLEAQARSYCDRLFRCFEGNDDFMGARLVLKTREGCEAELRKVNAQQPGRRDLQAQL